MKTNVSIGKKVCLVSDFIAGLMNECPPAFFETLYSAYESARACNEYLNARGVPVDITHKLVGEYSERVNKKGEIVPHGAYANEFRARVPKSVRDAYGLTDSECEDIRIESEMAIRRIIPTLKTENGEQYLIAMERSNLARGGQYIDDKDTMTKAIKHAGEEISARAMLFEKNTQKLLN